MKAKSKADQGVIYFVTDIYQTVGAGEVDACWKKPAAAATLSLYTCVCGESGLNIRQGMTSI